jgi:hypothetical protein
VKEWQREHGVEPTGVVRRDTIAAAKRDAGPKEEVSFDGDEQAERPTEARAPSENIFAGEEAPEMHAPSFADHVVEGDVTAGQEKREPAKAGEQAEAAKDALPDGIEMGAGAIGVENESAVGLAAFLPKIPHCLNLIREHKYGELVDLVVKSIGWEKRAEFIAHVIEAAAGELSPLAAKWLGRAVLAGAGVDVLLLGWEWLHKGFELIREAHEKGDRDARIGIYAFAWSETVLNGGHTNPGAVTAEEREAMKLGIEDGEATRELHPELPGLLRAEYGGNQVKAKRALEVALYKSAGYDGVK